MTLIFGSTSRFCCAGGTAVTSAWLNTTESSLLRISNLTFTSLMFSRSQKSRKSMGQPKKPPLTHFLCVPLVTHESRPILESRLKAFKDDVCAVNHGGKYSQATESGPAEALRGARVHSEGQVGSSGQSERRPIAEKAIRPVGALHLTIGVMSLDEQKLREAVQLLKSLSIPKLANSQANEQSSPTRMSGSAKEVLSQASDTVKETATVPKKVVDSIRSLARSISPLSISADESGIAISLRALHPMQAPHKTSILYASVEDKQNRLSSLCNNVRTDFLAQSFLIDDKRPLKLHATIVNTIYAARRKRGKPKRPAQKKGTPASTPKSNNDRATISGNAIDQAPNAGEGSQGNDEKPEDSIDRSSGHGPNANAPIKIDATDIIERYKDFVWADNIRLDRLSICEMGAKKVLNAKGEVVSEEYTEVASVALP